MVDFAPSAAEIRAAANDLRLDLDDADIGFYQSIAAIAAQPYARLAQEPDHLPVSVYPRAAARRPSAEEDPNNAWYVKAEILGAETGPLHGKTVAIKDNVCVASLPMMNGSATLDGYRPEIDATVVTRLLDAGATIIGKTHCEHFCLSAGSHTNPCGPTHNPYRRGYTTGGSSSGSAAAVAAGEADLAVGGDQGGSIRAPAAYCGIYGLKPTWGLVSYTGAMSIDPTLDHLGPMTRTVEDNAIMLEVLAGPDGLDPRQAAAPVAPSYVEAMKRGVRGLRIGVLAEGFGHPDSKPEIDGKVRAAANRFVERGAEVVEISIPDHALAPAIWLAISAEGLTSGLMLAEVRDGGPRGVHLNSLREAHARWPERGAALSESLKTMMLLGRHMTRHHGGLFYGKAQNLSRRLRASYDQALADVDLLLLPTTPSGPDPLPPEGAPRELELLAARGFLANTCAFNVSGHPALSAPCGMIDGLPVGMMLVGKWYDEASIYRAALAFEQASDWRSL